VQFVDIGVKLTVVPTIGRDGFVTMKIKPEISSAPTTVTTTAGSRIPIVETSEVETVVKVKDGSTIMIGGLLKEEKSDEISGAPGISKVPLLGALFRNRTKDNPKTELVIFLTPQIISGENPVQNTAKKQIPEDKVGGAGKK
jgi:type II secretory pathway component GspD/PulD (secretin)